MVDFEEEAAIAEFGLSFSTRLNHYPDFAPCMTAEEFPGVIGKAIQATEKAPRLGG